MEIEFLNLDSLTSEEKTIIFNVIRRDDELRKRLDSRISQVKSELQDIRQKSILRNGDDLSKICARCHTPFGLVFNNGDLCPVCHFRVCRNCHENLFSRGWMCKLCYKENQLKWLSGDWMLKDKKMKYISGTDLIRASFKHKHRNGLDQRTDQDGSKMAGRVQYPQDSDKRRLSSLFDSIRSGLGSSPKDDSVPLTSSASGGDPAQDRSVVQHVSCRRRRDSNSSSSSESGLGAAASSKRTSSTTSESASGSNQPKGQLTWQQNRSDTESTPNSPRSISLGGNTQTGSFSPGSVSFVSVVKDGQIKKSVEYKDSGSSSTLPETGDRPEMSRSLREIENRSENSVERPRKPSDQSQDVKPKNFGHNQDIGLTSAKPFELNQHYMLHAPHTSGRDDDQSSNCSFTSSEIGETTSSAPPELVLSSSPFHTTTEVSERPSSEVGQVSSSHSLERPPDHQEKISEDTSQTHTSVPVTETILGDDGQNMGEKEVQSDASSSESSTPRASLEIHEVPKVLQELPTLSSSVENVNVEILLVPSLPQSLSGSLVEPPLHSHEQTTAPEGHTLLEMVEPDPKGAYYGYLSPSADASFVPLHSPSFDTDNARPIPGVSRSSPSRSSPSGSRTQLSDGDHGTGTESPEKRSHLNVPTIRTSSHSESQEERSFEEDGENIDNEFTSQRYGSSLSISRNNIGDSRESLASVYSDAGEINYGRIPVTGDITFGLEYDPRRSVLNINLKNCTDLAPVDTKHNRSDPYVKVYLLPEKTRSGKRKSKIKKHTLNPVYNEVLTYNISQGELENRTLWVTVWHSDRFGRNDFLGEVVIPMDTYRFDDPTPCTYALQTRMPEAVNEATMQYKGDLIVSFMYVTPEKVATNNGQKSKSKSKKTKSAGTTEGELHVLIKSAKNLMAARSNGSSDPFVKGYLLPDRARGSKQKTPVVKNSVNPMWNHIMVFDGISQAELPERSLELTIWDHEKLGTNEFLGGVRTNLGQGKHKGAQVDWMDARGEEISLWQSVIDHPNSWIDAKLPLRASMAHRLACWCGLIHKTL